MAVSNILAFDHLSGWSSFCTNKEKKRSNLKVSVIGEREKNFHAIDINIIPL